MSVDPMSTVPSRAAAPVSIPTALAAAASTLLAIAPLQSQVDDREEARQQMVQEHIANPGSPFTAVEDDRVLRAMRAVPRHEFVPEQLRSLAYANRPLPIGHDQTISQPYIVARMTELLELAPGEKVLEVGTGSGYQAAVLAEITDSVYTIEIIEDLARTAEERLRRLGYDEVVVRHGDGYGGWPEHAPFDAIVVTAAPEEIPPPLIEQLARGGRMVIPRGPRGGSQVLLQVRKTPEGEIERRAVSGVRFVPLLRDTSDIRTREQR